jgi:hypothetical protein
MIQLTRDASPNYKLSVTKFTRFTVSVNIRRLKSKLCQIFRGVLSKSAVQLRLSHVRLGPHDITVSPRILVADPQSLLAQPITM